MTTMQLATVAWICIGVFWLALAIVGAYDAWLTMGEIRSAGVNGHIMSTAYGKLRMWGLHLGASTAVVVSGANALRPSPSGGVLLLALFGIIIGGAGLALVDLTKGWRPAHRNGPASHHESGGEV